MKKTFILPNITLSQNQLDGKHWTVKHEQKKYWHEAVFFICGRCDFKPTKARVTITRTSTRLIDPLNVPAGCKWLLDAFVETGWLRGDSYEDVIVVTEQMKCKKGIDEPHMQVEIEYLEE